MTTFSHNPGGGFAKLSEIGCEDNRRTRAGRAGNPPFVLITSAQEVDDKLVCRCRASERFAAAVLHELQAD
jgi:hypothetical protein